MLEQPSLEYLLLFRTEKAVPVCPQGVLLKWGSKRLPSWKALDSKAPRKEEEKATSKKSLFRLPSRKTPCGQGQFVCLASQES